MFVELHTTEVGKLRIMCMLLNFYRVVHFENNKQEQKQLHIIHVQNKTKTKIRRTQ
jgi:hypothetical protein